MRFSQKGISLAIIVIGTFMAILDTSIVNIAIPKMMAVFNASTDQIEWVLTAYMLTMAVVIPLTGLLGEKYGLKTMYIFAMATFTFGSLLCGVSWNLASMIVSRIIQAIGGGMIMPISMTLIYRIIPRQKIGMALGFWGIAAMAAPAIGPTLGGYLIDNVNWQLIFNVNLPIGIMGSILAYILLDEIKDQTVHHIDYWGAITIAIGLVTLLLALNNGNSDGWTSPYIISLFSIAFLSLALFITIELNSRDPLLDLGMLKNYPFTLSIMINMVTTIALFGGVFLIPIYLQNLRGLTPMQAGLLMLPSSLATGVTMPIGGRMYDRYGARPLVIGGMILLCITTYQLSLLGIDTSLEAILWLLVIRGIGMGFAMTALNPYSMSEIPNHKIGRASALANTVRQISSSFGVAALSSVMVHQNTIHLYRLSESINLTTPEASRLSTGLTTLGSQHGINALNSKYLLYQSLFGLVAKKAAMFSLTDSFLVASYVVVVGFVFALFINRAKKIPTGQKHALAAE